MGRPAAGGRADYPPEPRLYFPKSERVGAGVQPNWGYYSNASRAKRRREPGLPDSSDDTQNDPHEQDRSDGHRQRRLSWAKMIQKVYEIDPLLCAFCGGEVKILSFIIKPKTIKTILDAMDLPSQKPEPLAHSPPLFRDTGASAMVMS